MHVYHGTSVLVTDGCKALLLQNHGDAEYPNLRLASKWEHPLGFSHELRSEAPGRSFASHEAGTRRSSQHQSDLHSRAEEQFTAELVERLNANLEGNEIHDLIIVAPPRTLGEVRKHLKPPISKAVRAEIPKDLVKHPIADIERLLVGYSPA